MDKKLADTIAEMTEWINDLVAGGFDSEQEIAESAPEIFEDEVEDAEQLRDPARRLTRESIEKHLSEQKSWPDVTDCDRLDNAFNELEESGIISRQNFSCCGTCGSYDIGEPIKEAMDAGRDVRGYTFYHQQDTEAAVEGHGLCFAYGAIEDGEDAALKIAHEITRVLKKHELHPEWDGSWNKRIVLPLDWKRRRTLA